MEFAESSKHYHARRERGLCGRHGCETYSGRASLCRKHLEEQRHRTASRTAKRRREMRGLNLAAISTLAGAFLALALPTTARGDNTTTKHDQVTCVCPEPENGAREGETLEQRAERLERAWRLTRAELYVNRRGRAPRR